MVMRIGEIGQQPTGAEKIPLFHHPHKPPPPRPHDVTREQFNGFTDGWEFS